MSVVMATFTVSMMPRASVAAGRLQEVLDTPSSVVPPAIPVIPTAARSSVELLGVGLHHPGAAAPLLPDIPFTTEASRTPDVVGSTRAAYHTHVGLTPRLFSPTEGSVLLARGPVLDQTPDH